MVYYKALEIQQILIGNPLQLEKEMREMERLPELRDWRTSGTMYVKRIYTLLRLPLIRCAISTTFVTSECCLSSISGVNPDVQWDFYSPRTRT